MSAKAGRARLALFTLSRSPLTSAGAATATRSAQLRLTPAGARLLRTQLRLKRLPRGTVGTLRLALRTAPAATPAPAPGATTPAPATLRARAGRASDARTRDARPDDARAPRRPSSRRPTPAPS